MNFPSRGRPLRHCRSSTDAPSTRNSTACLQPSTVDQANLLILLQGPAGDVRQLGPGREQLGRPLDRVWPRRQPDQRCLWARLGKSCSRSASAVESSRIVPLA